MSAMVELAERCEKATGPDRELSAAIALAVHDWLHEAEGNKPLNCRIRNSYGSPVYIGGASDSMHYTSSLDAAMTLVPEGYQWAVGSWGNPDTDGPWAWCATEQQSREMDLAYAAAATPALALCAATLRARGAEQ